MQIETDEKVHSARLKERLLKHLPDLRAHNKGRDVFLVFQNDIGAALVKVVEQDDDDDDDAVQLAHAAKIVRKDLFEKSSSFNGSFRKGCQEDSVPELLFALVSMILDGLNINPSDTKGFGTTSVTKGRPPLLSHSSPDLRT